MMFIPLWPTAVLFLCVVDQVVKAKVLMCDAEKDKLLLSFKKVTQSDIEKVPRVKFDFEVGKVKYYFIFNFIFLAG